MGLRLQSVLFEPDVVAHLGADLFAVLLPKLAKAEDIHLVIEKIQKLLLSPFSIDGLPIAVEASIGVALYPEQARTPEDLLRRADIAMHAAKESGSGLALYDPTLDKHHPQRLALMAELRQAIDQNHLLLHCQPKISIRDKKTVGAEALVRWNHPQQGMIPPDEFIGPAERTGLIHPMTYWLLTIVRSTIELAHNLGLMVVAEGVENQEILARLTEMGCDAAQGYFISRPLPVQELTRWLCESSWASAKSIRVG